MGGARRRLQVRVLDARIGRDFPLPQYATSGSAGVDLRACDRYKGSAAAVQNVKTPTVLILGSQDRMSPAKAAAPLAKIPGSKTIVIDQAGHMTMTEQPGRTLDALRTLL